MEWREEGGWVVETGRDERQEGGWEVAGGDTQRLEAVGRRETAVVCDRGDVEWREEGGRWKVEEETRDKRQAVRSER